VTEPTIRTTPTWLDGLWATLLGVPDLWLVLDSPRCMAELLVESGAEDHAWRQRLLRLDGHDRVFSTDLSISKVDLGETAAMLARIAALAREGTRPGAILVSEMAPARVIGNDLAALSREVEAATGVATRVVEHLSLTRDGLDAYGAAGAALARAMPDAALAGDRDSVAVVGLMADRAEADALADARELRALVGSLGVDVSAVWTSCEPVAALAAAGSSRRIVALPCGREAALTIAARSGAEVLEANLPVGLDGTARWLRAVGAWLGRDREAERAVEAGLAGAVPLVAPLVPSVFAGRRIAVVAEPALAAGLCGWLAELGVRVEGPIVRCRRAEGIPAGLATAGDVRGFDPSVESLTRWMSRLIEDGPLDLVVGSSREREVLRSFDTPFLELGYPSIHYRPLRDAPRVGFAGAVHLAERLANRLAETRYERLVRRHARGEGRG
jgi:nitrogenase molybdenum-iron protein alpha/beta subunit